MNKSKQTKKIDYDELIMLFANLKSKHNTNYKQQIKN